MVHLRMPSGAAVGRLTAAAVVAGLLSTATLSTPARASVVDQGSRTSVSQAAATNHSAPDVALTAAVPEPSPVHFAGVGHFATGPTAGTTSVVKMAPSAIFRSGPYTQSACSANITLWISSQVCIKIWATGAYGNKILAVEGKFALFKSGRHTYKWEITGKYSLTRSWWWSHTGDYGQPWWHVPQLPQRYDTGKLAVNRYEILGTRIWIKLFQWEGKWVQVRAASMIIY